MNNTDYVLGMILVNQIVIMEAIQSMLTTPNLVEAHLKDAMEISKTYIRFLKNQSLTTVKANENDNLSPIPPNLPTIR